MIEVIALASVGGLGIAAVFTLALLGRRDRGKACSWEIKATKTDMATSMLESELLASRQQRTNLAEALIAARNQARQLEKDFEDVASSLTTTQLDRIRADIDGLLSFAEVPDDPSGDPDKLPAVNTSVPGIIGSLDEVPD